MNNWEPILELLLIGSTKFMFAPFVAEARHQMDFWDAFTYTTAGGIVGIIVFTFFGEGVIAFWNFFAKKITKFFKGDKQIRVPKKFNWRTRLIINVKMRFGLMGIAFVTPCIISIPFGCLVAVGFFKKKLKVVFATSLWLIFWSFILNSAAQFLGLSKYFI